MSQSETAGRLGHVGGEKSRVVRIEAKVDNVGQPDEGPLVEILIERGGCVVPCLSLVGAVGRAAVVEVNLRLDSVQQRRVFPGARYSMSTSEESFL
jgi:hypothetical protein